jgi:thiosulfate/3-mercaptopyruvate sulfurtransferase
MKACGQCHESYAEAAQHNIHRAQTGYVDQLSHRGGDFTDPTFATAYNNHCTSCHADCGDCHISRPSALGGGLISGHRVKKTASVWLTCGGCHSTRIADDYRGNHEGIPGDVHWEQKGMACSKCHDASSMHEGTHGTRYDNGADTACIDCHEDVTSDNIEQHDDLHLEKMDCQTCHAAGAYKSCYGCHTGIDDKGIKFFASEPSQMTFKIGRNPLKSEDRPWDWVLVRHAPTNPDLFAFYGDNLLPDFDNVPTWKYTTPHNTQTVTPQNTTCNNCHGQDELFLTEKDVDPAERAANQAVIVAPEDIPQYLPDQPEPVMPGEEGGS